MNLPSSQPAILFGIGWMVREGGLLSMSPRILLDKHFETQPYSGWSASTVSFLKVGQHLYYYNIFVTIFFLTLVNP